METERNACGYCRQPMVTTVPYQLCAVHVVEYYRGLLDARQAQALGSALTEAAVPETMLPAHQALGLFLQPEH